MKKNINLLFDGVTVDMENEEFTFVFITGEDLTGEFFKQTKLIDNIVDIVCEKNEMDEGFIIGFRCYDTEEKNINNIIDMKDVYMKVGKNLFKYLDNNFLVEGEKLHWENIADQFVNNSAVGNFYCMAKNDVKY